MKGLILAAGKGSRLYPITYLIPKPLLPLANRITLDYAFEKLREIGVTDIGVVVGENEEAMKQALGDGSHFGVSLTYIRQPEPKGLAHAVSFAKDFINGDPFVLYLGDAMYSDGFVALKQRFVESGCANLNLVKPVEDPSRFGVANVEGDRIVKLVEKPKHPESNLAMAGLYFFGPEIWEIFPKLQPSARGEYEITDAIQMLIDEGKLVLAGVYEGAWFDTGTLDSFLETSAFLIDGRDRIAASSAVEGKVKDKVVVGEAAHVECESIEDSVILPSAVVKVKGKIKHCILAGPVESDGDLTDKILHGDWKG
ncbi:MAG: NTP transferase domain-containing protein [Armatimonadetes bacterium]|nr:NTP transferase domain-containing protein [Armatimonadota bacterium]